MDVSLNGVTMTGMGRPAFCRIITVSFAKDSIYCNLAMGSENNEIDDLSNAQSYAEANNYEFIKLGECVTDEEFIKRENKEKHWYRFNSPTISPP